MATAKLAKVSSIYDVNSQFSVTTQRTSDWNQGEVVVDLGSGAGFDVFLAANKVGPNGKAVGVDMSKVSRSPFPKSL